MDFIEVTGESKYEECPVKLIIDIDVIIRVAKEESAERDIQKLVNSLIN